MALGDIDPSANRLRKSGRSSTDRTVEIVFRRLNLGHHDVIIIPVSSLARIADIYCCRLSVPSGRHSVARWSCDSISKLVLGVCCSLLSATINGIEASPPTACRRAYKP